MEVYPCLLVRQNLKLCRFHLVGRDLGVGSGATLPWLIHELRYNETRSCIRGVGLWTAHWLLIRAIGSSDGFPHDDLALQRTLGLLVGGGNPLRPEQVLDYSRRWSPFRSYVTAYLFAALRSGRLPKLNNGG